MQIELKLLKHQKKYLFHKKPFGALVAGYGAGKSYIATIKTIYNLITNPGLNAAYYLPTYPLIRDIAYEKFPEILVNVFKITNFTLNKSTAEIILHDYKNKVIFRSMEGSGEKIIGYEVFYSVIDESDTLPEDKMEMIYKKILGRNRQKVKTGFNQLDTVSTPEGFGWLYKTFVEKKKDTQELIKAKTTDNPHLPKTYIEQLKDQYEPELLKQYMEGEFVNINGNTVYSFFNRTKFNTTENIIKGEELLVGQDFNFNGSVSIVSVIRGSKIMILDEILSKNTFNVVENIKEKYKGHKITIYPDASGKNNSTNSSKSDIDILREAGFKIVAPSKNPRIVDRVNSVNNLMKINNFLINVDNCPSLTKALEQQVYDKNGKPEKQDGIAGSTDDYLDAMGYFINQKHKIIKPNLKSFQMS